MSPENVRTSQSAFSSQMHVGPALPVPGDLCQNSVDCLTFHKTQLFNQIRTLAELKIKSFVTMINHYAYHMTAHSSPIIPNRYLSPNSSYKFGVEKAGSNGTPRYLIALFAPT